MFKLGMVGALAALLFFGFAQTSFAFPDNAMDADGDDASPSAADILSLTVTSTGGGTDEITVTMVLQAATTLNGAKYRVHFDYTGDLASEDPAGCATTSDDTSKTSRRRGSFKDTGPGIITGQGTTTLVFTVSYAELGLVSGDDVEIWADTQMSGNPTFKGIRDRSPDTDGGDGCSKPEGASEVLQITLD
jgi:hypothetical protein